MEALLRHLKNILELLAVSQTDRAREWDHHTVQRSFQWAEYCEQLHSRFQSNPTVRSALESGLNDTNQRLQDSLPSYSPVMFSDLAQCRHKLLVHLLRNPYAPNSVVQMLCPDPKTAAQEFQIDQSSFITCRSAFNLLCCTLDRNTHAGLQVEAEVRGKLLGKLLNSLLTRSGNDEYARTVLDSILRDSAGKIESLYDIIAAALLSSNDESNAVTQNFILDWLRDNDGCLSKLCKTLSPGVCTVLSRQSPEFKQAYWGVLKHWASCLEYDVLESVWAPTSDETVTFNVLADRFKDLLNSGPPLKKDTETELKVLKLEGGDFNVKGINIWTDLIIQLKL
ncbi:Fanconi anemia group F protein [Anabarilius grahami]|uniref:Fanconi anemia group F protein n=1 Tax=Anabarilius grahami TaxID=495550 RepID=A0A3N0XQN4_ANAGA|nr:Fanconi anemia group F protein [Anabarilius grahami]